MDENQVFMENQEQPVEKKKKSKKKIAIIVVVILLILALIAVAAVIVVKNVLGKGKDSNDKVYVEKVTVAMNGLGVTSRYSGKVETQETLEIKKDSDKKVAEVYVKEGDEVKEGTVLFSYDVSEIEEQIKAAELDVEGYGYSITSLNNQIADMTATRNQAPSDQKLEYTMEIQQLEAQLRQTEYDKSLKETEIESLKKSLENADVESTMDGIVKSINNSDEYSESESAFITILQAGDYRVKGKVDEQSYFSGEISEGQAVVVRSRVNEDTVWYGTIASVVTEEVDNSDSENNYYYDSGSTEQATKYPFYVELNSSEGLLLGQHVFIEPDYGQIQTHEGIWLSEGYFEFADDNNVYVWVADKNNKLTRRQVELGERDENTWEYQVLSGLSEDDYICFYMSGLYEGITCVTNTEEIDYSSELYSGKTDGEGEYTGENDELSGMDNLGGFEDTATGQIDSPFVLSGNPEDYGSLEDMGLTLDEESGLYKDADGYYYKFDGQSTEEPVEGESSTEDEPTTMEEQEAR